MGVNDILDHTAFVVITDNSEVDQICSTLDEASNEAKWLRRAGFRTKIKSFATWLEAEQFAERFTYG